jgi:hypothetical protein
MFLVNLRPDTKIAKFGLPRKPDAMAGSYWLVASCQSFQKFLNRSGAISVYRTVASAASFLLRLT